MTREVDLIVHGGAVVTMGERRTILRDGAVVVVVFVCGARSSR